MTPNKIITLVIIGILLISNDILAALYFGLRSDLQKSMVHEATLSEQVKSLGTDVEKISAIGSNQLFQHDKQLFGNEAYVRQYD